MVEPQQTQGQPTGQQPMYQQPVYQQPGQQPIYQQPGQPQVYQQPGQQPMYQQPPVYQQPGQQPMYQQPGQPQMYQQPAQQTYPAAQPVPTGAPAGEPSQDGEGRGPNGGIMKDLKDCAAEDRVNFVKKVYSILFVQLAITAAVTTPIVMSETACVWMYVNTWLYWLTFAVLIVVEITLFCVRPLSRKVPINYILLLIFTLCESYFVAWICAVEVFTPTAACGYIDGFLYCQGYISDQGYKTVISALVMTVAMVVGLTAYACTTKNDFTTKMAAIWMFGLVFTIMVLMSCIFYSYIVNMILCGIGVFLFGMYLILDTQLIMGKGRHKLSIDDYILGAMILYIDIIMIFIYLLSLFGGRR